MATMESWGYRLRRAHHSSPRFSERTGPEGGEQHVGLGQFFVQCLLAFLVFEVGGQHRARCIWS